MTRKEIFAKPDNSKMRHSIKTFASNTQDTGFTQVLQLTEDGVGQIYVEYIKTII